MQNLRVSKDSYQCIVATLAGLSDAARLLDYNI